MTLDSHNAHEAPLDAVQKEIKAIDTVCYEIFHLTYMAPERIRMCARLYDRIASELDENRVAYVSRRGKSLSIHRTTVTRTASMSGAPWKIIVTPVNNKGDRRWR